VRLVRLQLLARQVRELQREAVQQKVAALALELPLDACEAEVGLIVPAVTLFAKISQLLLDLADLAADDVVEVQQLGLVSLGPFANAFQQCVFLITQVAAVLGLAGPQLRRPQALGGELRAHLLPDRRPFPLQFCSLSRKPSSKSVDGGLDAAKHALELDGLVRPGTPAVGVPLLELREQLLHPSNLEPDIGDGLLCDTLLLVEIT